MKKRRIEFIIDFRKIIILVLFFIGYTSFAQKGAIRGKIIDNLTEQPIEGVTVIFLADSTETNTNPEGLYRRS